MALSKKLLSAAILLPIYVSTVCVLVNCQGGESSGSANPSEIIVVHDTDTIVIHDTDIEDTPSMITCPACNGTGESYRGQVTPLMDRDLIGPPGEYVCPVCQGKKVVPKDSKIAEQWQLAIEQEAAATEARIAELERAMEAKRQADAATYGTY